MQLTDEKIEDIVKGISEKNKEKIIELYTHIDPKKFTAAPGDSYGFVEECYFFNQCANLKSMLYEIKTINEQNSQ